MGSHSRAVTLPYWCNESRTRLFPDSSPAIAGLLPDYFRTISGLFPDYCPANFQLYPDDVLGLWVFGILGHSELNLLAFFEGFET